MIVLCKWCNEEKEHSVRGNGRPAGHCKECQRAYSKSHYTANKEKHNARRRAHNKRRRGENIMRIREMKAATPCTGCENRFPHYVMEFDHIGTDKVACVGGLASLSWERVLAEIVKCEIVCANCHSIRTWQRKQAHNGV